MSERDAIARLARRGRRRRALFWLCAGAALVLAILLLRCGGGFGLGGGGTLGGGSGWRGLGGDGRATAPAERAPRTCALRLDGSGLSLDGRPATLDAAITACRAVGTADVVVTGEARQGTWDEVRVALERAAIAVRVRGAGVSAAEGADAGVAPSVQP